MVASGTPHVDVHKLWDPAGGRCLMEVGFSCMGGEIPAALGVRMARPDAGEIYVVIGDGTYLMGNTGELVTARQEGLKLTVIVIENRGYQSIHGLQRDRTGQELRPRVPRRSTATTSRSTTRPTRAASAAPRYRAETEDELADALDAARAEPGPS